MGLEIPFVGRGPHYGASSMVFSSNDLDALMKDVQARAANECAYWSRTARDWGSTAIILATLSTLGSGAAGATAVVGSLTSSSTKTVVALLAFAGAALSGMAAAVGAPSQAKSASLRGDSFSALERWASFSLAQFPEFSRQAKETRLREILAWRDEILGVTTPTSLQSHRSSDVDQFAPSRYEQTNARGT